jgi:uracil-DNA glycosylase
MSRFDRLLRELASVDVSHRACNQYSSVTGDVTANSIRRRNLGRYLELLDALHTRTLLIGEAPSYRGGRVTGIPFVSEVVMLNGVTLDDSLKVLGAEHGFRRAVDEGKPTTEASATMVWGTIRSMSPLPLLWNAFPFHPFHDGNPFSNRAPSAGELEIGARFIAMLLRLFTIEQVVAIGNHASTSLTEMNIAHTKVRHPSNGGKNKFVEGMSALPPRTATR